MSAPRRPRPDMVPGSPEHRLIRGVLRMDLPSLDVEQVVVARTDAWTVSLVDSGEGSTWSPAGDTTVHMLWQQDEGDAWVDLGAERFPIAPGDTMSVPAGPEVRLAGGMLLVTIEAARGALDSVIPPSHGTETFAGYNRRTDYETPGAFTVERWKITQPLEIPAHDTTYALIGLAEPLALAWTGGTDLLGRGECRMIDPGVGPITLLPDGLGYALIVRDRGPAEK